MRSMHWTELREKTVEAAYQEPMTLALSEQPVAIEAIE